MVNIRLDEKINAKIFTISSNRTAFILDAINEKLGNTAENKEIKQLRAKVAELEKSLDAEIGENSRLKRRVEHLSQKTGQSTEIAEEELTSREKGQIIKKSKRIDELMDEAIQKRLEREKDFLEDLDRDQFAKLVLQRLPKSDVGDKDLNEDILSLTSFLDNLDEVDDLSKDINHLKMENSKMTHQLNMKDMMVSFIKKGNENKEYEYCMQFANKIYRHAVEYCIEMCIRGNLPIIGDGKGLLPRDVENIAKDVKNNMQEFIKGVELK